jgi:hypothetical protein
MERGATRQQNQLASPIEWRILGEMPEIHPTASDRYSVVVRRPGRDSTWTWEILRKPEPLGVKFYGDDFKSEQAAKLAGEKALHDLLTDLANKEVDA